MRASTYASPVSERPLGESQGENRNRPSGIVWGASVNVVIVGSEPASQSKERGQRGRYPPTYHWRDRALSRPRPVLREAQGETLWAYSPGFNLNSALCRASRTLQRTGRASSTASTCVIRKV